MEESLPRQRVRVPVRSCCQTAVASLSMSFLEYVIAAGRGSDLWLKWQKLLLHNRQHTDAAIQFGNVEPMWSMDGFFENHNTQT
jgi:hypothetical protein